MKYRGVKIELDTHFIEPRSRVQVIVRMESPTQTCWFDKFTTCINYIRGVYGFKYAG